MDIQKGLSNLPAVFTTGKYTGELHIPGYNFTGPGTRLELRLNPDNTPKSDSIPINGIDWLAYHHDLAYRSAGDNLEKKHEADKIMIDGLDKLEGLTIRQRLTRWMVKKIMQSKVKFGLGINYNKHGNNCIKCLLIHGKGLSLEQAKIMHKSYRKPKFFRKIINFRKNEIWYADLMVMPKDNGFKYILTILDGFTRFAWAVPLKTKKGEEVVNAFKSIGVRSERLCVDEGKEFYNNFMYKLYHFEKGKDINKIYSIYGESKNALIERFNKTLGNKLWMKFTINQNQKWIKILPEVVEEYNNTFHRSIGMTPKQAYENPTKVKNEIEIINKKKKKFKVGDDVYIYK